MCVIRWSLLGTVATAWAVYLAYLVVAAATGVELRPAPLRSAFLGALVAVTAAALVVVAVGRAVRRIERFVSRQAQAVELGRQLERLRQQDGREATVLAFPGRGPHDLPTQYDR